MKDLKALSGEDLFARAVKEATEAVIEIAANYPEDWRTKPYDLIEPYIRGAFSEAWASMDGRAWEGGNRPTETPAKEKAE
jgi:hypothetical protein